MTVRTEPQVIADMLDQTRKLVLIYLKRLEGKDWHKRFEADGKVFNSVYWEVAHIAWAESMLVLSYLGDTTTAPAWLKQFALGTNPADIQDFPPVEQLMATLNLIHARALELVSNLHPDRLDEPCHVPVTKWDTDLRHVLFHAIRHEGTHSGHLSWLIKLHGNKLL